MGYGNSNEYYNIIVGFLHCGQAELSACYKINSLFIRVIIES